MGQTGHLTASTVCLAVLYKYGAARSTWNIYSTGQQRYLTFCTDAQRQAVPTSESTFMLLVSHLANLRRTHSTIKVYLSAICHLHVTQGKHSQFSTELTPRLQQVLKGIKKASSHHIPSKSALTNHTRNNAGHQVSASQPVSLLLQYHDLGCMLPSFFWLFEE